MLVDEDLTKAINAAAIEVHRTLGAGLLESAYQKCLARGLELRGIGLEKELDLPVDYKGATVESGDRLDFVVEGRGIVEVNAVESISDIHHAQLLTYLKLSGNRVGLLLNFHSTRLVSRNGCQRLVL